MGTRATVKFYSEFQPDKCLLSISHSFDGYFEGVGHELAKFIQNKKVINGVSYQTTQAGFANTMGCLALQYAAFIKKEIAGNYAAHESDVGEFNYEVRLIQKQLFIEVAGKIYTPEQLLLEKDD